MIADQERDQQIEQLRALRSRTWRSIFRDMASAGVAPPVVWDMTLGEISVTLEGYNAARKHSLIDRISAVIRAFDKRPFKGLSSEADQPMPSERQMMQKWFWGPRK